MYETMQDHLEPFFGAVWLLEDVTITPKFTAAYKHLLLRSLINGGKGNCEKRDQIEILPAATNSCKIKEKTITLTIATLNSKYDLQERTLV